MEEWWRWLKWKLFTRKPKPTPKKLREFVVPSAHTLAVLALYDKYRNAKGSATVEKHNMWKKIQEVCPIPTGTWQIDVSNVTRVVIREVIDDQDE